MNVALVSQANTRQTGKRTKSLVEVNQKMEKILGKGISKFYK